MSLFFIKFSEKEFIEQLYREGLVYFNNFDFFRYCENKEQSDKNENITFLHQRHPNAYISLDGTKFPLAEDSHVCVFDPNLHKNFYTHYFCLYSCKKDSLVRSDFKVFDDRLYEFGDTMLIIHDISEFLKRFTSAIKTKIKDNEIIKYEARHIEYLDFSTYEGRVEAFKKANKYAHQSEWRMAIRNKNLSKPYKLRIGSLEDISVIMSAKNCKNKTVFDANKDYDIVL